MINAHYEVPNISVNADSVDGSIELIHLVVGSDLILVLLKSTKDFTHRYGPTSWTVPEYRVDAIDNDGNTLATLLVMQCHGDAQSLLTLAVPTAERLFPNYLTMEQ